MNVAGLDLSTSNIGYAAPDGSLHSVTSRAGADDVPRRLDELCRGLLRIIRITPPTPDLIVIEGYSLASPGRLALIRLGEIGGTVRRELFLQDLPYVERAPSNVKRFATGNGNADKPQMIAAARARGASPRNDDEADAFHLRRMGRCAHQLEPMLNDDEIDAVSVGTW